MVLLKMWLQHSKIKSLVSCIGYILIVLQDRFAWACSLFGSYSFCPGILHCGTTVSWFQNNVFYSDECVYILCMMTILKLFVLFTINLGSQDLCNICTSSPRESVIL